jgi:hypothetical protein
VRDAAGALRTLTFGDVTLASPTPEDRA